MTNEEAIRRLRDHFAIHDDGRPTPYLDEAERMAYYALEKQIPKKPYKVGFTAYECPKCHKFLHMVGYPCRCGQAIDWSDTE